MSSNGDKVPSPQVYGEYFFIQINALGDLLEE